MRVLVPFGGRRVIGVVDRRGDARRRAGRSRTSRTWSTRARSSQPPLLDLAAWMAEHYLAPPGECYRLVLPPAGVRASRAVVRLVTPGRGRQHGRSRAAARCRTARCALSTLAHRLGRDPQARARAAAPARASSRSSRT